MSTELGLEVGVVRIEPHSTAWSEAYARESALLRTALGDVAVGIEHVGSTAVPGLDAKPILDIAVAIPRADAADEASKRLAHAGYHFAVDAGSAGGLIFFRAGDGTTRTHHVHVVTLDDPQWRNYLRFRDLLREDANLRRNYTELKRRLAVEYASDRDGYTKAKTEFVTATLAAAS